MANLKSYMSLGIGLLVILSSQVLAHKLPEPLVPNSDSENDKISGQTPHGTIPGAAIGKKNYIILSGFIWEAKDSEDISVDKYGVMPPKAANWMTFRANPWMNNGAKTIPGSRRLLRNFGEEIKLP